MLDEINDKYPIASFAAALRGDLANAGMTSGDIVRSKKDGHVPLPASTNLPKKGDWELLKSWGCEILGDADDLFYEVKLPAGWSKRTTDHDLWSELLDEQNRKRASIFYKAAFYDRDAHISPVKNRFVVRDSYSEEFIQFFVKGDCNDLILFTGEPVVYAYRASDPSCVGVISEGVFWFDAKGGCGQEFFAKNCAVSEATAIAVDEFYRDYHNREILNYNTIDAARHLATADCRKWIKSFLAGRDQWSIATNEIAAD